MHVVKQFAQGKYGDLDRCEDAVVVGDAFIAVVDGVSDRTGRRYDGKLGGRWAAEQTAATLAGLPADCTARHAVDAITGRLAAGEQRLYPGDPSVAPAGAVAVILSRARREIWRVGDAEFIVDGVRHQAEVPLFEQMAAVRAAFVQALLLEGMTAEQIGEQAPDWEFMMPLFERQHQFSNLDHPLGYGVLNGRPVPDCLLEIHRLEPDAREVVLGSDGYPMLFGTLADTEAYLAGDLRADPLRVGRHPGFRALSDQLVSFDGRAYARVRL